MSMTSFKIIFLFLLKIKLFLCDFDSKRKHYLKIINHVIINVVNEYNIHIRLLKHN